MSLEPDLSTYTFKGETKYDADWGRDFTVVIDRDGLGILSPEELAAYRAKKAVEKAAHDVWLRTWRGRLHTAHRWLVDHKPHVHIGPCPEDY